MSPLPVRRFRAERLLRKEFEAMRGRVLTGVRARLRAAGVSLDAGDLEACYAQAWHGLYTVMLEGRTEVANPEGWLALVTYRRAIDEHRARTRASTTVGMAGAAGAGYGHVSYEPGAPERDLAGELDDRVRLRQLMEGLRARLGPRERQAAALCYLQGLSRADAAARMGISEARMRKLMEGSSAGSPGVAGKVGELLNTIRAGSYCAEQDSLMRGFAFGILDPQGERYALALAHQRECPACRAHVLSLRGLAAVLPPLPLPFLLAGVAAGAAGGAGAGAGASGAGAGASSAGAGAGGMGATAGVSGAGVGAGAGVGGGWLIAGGGIGAKLAVGCLVAVSVGAGCVALSLNPIAPIVPSHSATTHRHRQRHAHVLQQYAPVAYEALTPAPVGAQLTADAAPRSPRVAAAGADAAHSLDSASAKSRPKPAAMAQREFGIEQTAGRAATRSSASQSSVSETAHAASADTGGGEGDTAGASGSSSSTSSSSSSSSGPAGMESAGTHEGAHEQSGSSAHERSDASAASREFGLQ